MPWWFWIILWSVLVLASLLFLAFLLWKVFLKAATAFEEFLTLNNSFSAVWESSVSYPQRIENERKSAIFTPVSEAYANYEQGKQEREYQRVSRRIEKRDTLGQPQRIGDLRIQARKGAQNG